VARESENVQKENHQSDAIRESEEARARTFIHAHIDKLGTTFAVLKAWARSVVKKVLLAGQLP
jgi:hypothetical protein